MNSKPRLFFRSGDRAFGHASPRRWRKYLPGVVLLAAAIVVVGLKPRFSGNDASGDVRALSSTEEKDFLAARERFGNYDAAQRSVDEVRWQLAAQWRRASFPHEKNAVLVQAQAAFVEAVGERLSPFWYGTPWDFNGTTKKPQQGTIACGYFVATVLSDAGVNLHRVQTAQQASQVIIRSLTTEEFIKTGHGLPIGEFVAKVRSEGPGLSVVGLDTHVGLLWHDGAEVWFVHSAVVEGVVKEKAEDSPTLAGSRYRVFGKITDDPKFLTAWVTGKELPVKAASEDALAQVSAQ